jgi:MFS family permease
LFLRLSQPSILRTSGASLSMYNVGGWLSLLTSRRLPGVQSGISRNVLLLGLTSLFTDISSEMVVSVLPIYLVTFLRLSPVQFGLIDGLYQGVAALVQLASGVVADRWQRHKEVAWVGYAGSALSRLGLLATTAWTGIAGVLVIDRLGKGLRTAPRDAMISLSVPKEHLGSAFGVHRAMDAMGAMLGPILAFVILAGLPGAFDVVFVTSFLVALIGLAVLGLFVESRSTDVEPSSMTVAAAAGAIWQLLRTPAFRHLVIGTLILSVMTMSDAFVYLVLQRQMNFAAGSFPLLYVVTSLGFLVLAIPVGRIADRIGRFRVFVAGYGVLLFLYALLIWAPPTLGVLIIVILLLSAYYAATEGVLMALGSAVLPDHVRTTGLAVLTMATALARLAASVFFGFVWMRFGIQPAVSIFMVGLATAIAVTLLAMPRAERAHA